MGLFALFLVGFLTDHLLLKPVPRCRSPSIIITKFFLRVHYLPHKSLHSRLANLITGSGFNPPCTEKPLQLFIQTRNLMECACCLEQFLAGVSRDAWGCALQGFGPSSPSLKEGEREGRNRKWEKNKLFHQAKEKVKVFRFQMEKILKILKIIKIFEEIIDFQ